MHRKETAGHLAMLIMAGFIASTCAHAEDLPVAVAAQSGSQAEAAKPETKTSCPSDDQECATDEHKRERNLEEKRGRD